MEDGLKQIDVCTRRHFIEEAAAGEVHAIAQSCGLELRTRSFHHVWAVEEDAMHAAVMPEDRAQQGAITSTDVGDCSYARKVVAFRDRLGGWACEAAHRHVEHSGVGRMARVVLPALHSMGNVESRLTCLDGVVEVLACGPVERPVEQAGQSTEAIEAQLLAERRQLEAAVAILLDDIQANEHPEQPQQRLFM